MKLNSFKDLYIEELRDLYDAEHQLLKGLPQVAEAAVLPDLKQILANHLEQTSAQIQRLETIFQTLQIDPRGNPCRTMAGLVAECNDLIQEEAKADPGVLDAALIAATQKIEHFEIAGYGCARTFAAILGEKEAAAILQKSLDEEGDMNKLLNSLAMRSVNVEAIQATAPDADINKAMVSALEATR